MWVLSLGKEDPLEENMATHFSILAWRNPTDRGACQAALSIEFSKQEYWSGLPFSSPGGLPHSGIKPVSLVSPALTGGFFTTSATWESPRRLKFPLQLSSFHSKLTSELLLKVHSLKCRCVLAYTSKCFQPLFITQFQSYCTF